MKQYSISYITRSGVTVLNMIVDATSIKNAIEQIADESTLVLSCVPVNPYK